MSPTARPIKQILADDAMLARWIARRRRVEALTAAVRRALPRPLAERVRVLTGEGDELTLACDAGANAALIRQRGPDVLAALRREGWEFSGLRLRVQVRTPPVPTAKTVANQLDRSALRPLAGLARGLPAGPLKAALERMLRRCG